MILWTRNTKISCFAYIDTNTRTPSRNTKVTKQTRKNWKFYRALICSRGRRHRRTYCKAWVGSSLPKVVFKRNFVNTNYYLIIYLLSNIAIEHYKICETSWNRLNSSEISEIIWTLSEINLKSTEISVFSSEINTVRNYSI